MVREEEEVHTAALSYTVFGQSLIGTCLRLEQSLEGNRRNVICKMRNSHFNDFRPTTLSFQQEKVGRKRRKEGKEKEKKRK